MGIMCIKVVCFTILSLSLVLVQSASGDSALFCHIDDCPDGAQLGESCDLDLPCSLGLGCNNEKKVCNYCTPANGKCIGGELRLARRLGIEFGEQPNTCCSGYACSGDKNGESTCKSCATGTSCEKDEDCRNGEIGNGCENHYCNKNTLTCFLSSCKPTTSDCHSDDECCSRFCTRNNAQQVGVCSGKPGYGQMCTEGRDSCNPGQWCGEKTIAGNYRCALCTNKACGEDSDCENTPGCSTFVCSNGKCAIDSSQNCITLRPEDAGDDSLPDRNRTCITGEQCCIGLGCLGGECVPCKGEKDICNGLYECCEGFQCMSKSGLGSHCVWSGVGSECSSIQPCLDGTVCYRGQCILSKDICLARGEICSSTSTPCCEGLACKSDSNKCDYCAGIESSCETQPCCRGYRCDETSKQCKLCMIGAECKADTDCLGLGCENLVCHSSKCHPCTSRDSECGEGNPSCCAGDQCIAGKCTGCITEGNECGEGECCDDLTCHEGTCEDCIAQGISCTKGGTSCCGDLTCHEDKCMDCLDMFQSCPEGGASCCGDLTCYEEMCIPNCVLEAGECKLDDDCCGYDEGKFRCKENTCQVNCREEGDSCSNYGGIACCDKMTCLDKKCQDCIAEGDQCGEGDAEQENCGEGDDETACPASGDRPCCGGLTCHKNTCTDCIAEGDQCGEGECCGDLTCHEGTCEDCIAQGISCTEGGTSCCGDLTCHEDKCMDCIAQGISCTEGGTSCCGDLTCHDGWCTSDGDPGNSALSLFNMNMLSKQFVAFLVVMMAGGLL